MIRKTIADFAVEMMRDNDIQIVMWGDGLLPAIYCAYGKRVHPLDAMGRVLNALEKDDRFEKAYYRGHDSSMKPRLVRGFKLKE